MICKLGKNLLDVDVKSTKRFYNNANIITDSCNCDGCNNFVSGTDKLPNEVLIFFSQFGININKPAEIFVNCAEDNGKSLFYAGFYHICGKMLSETIVGKVIQISKAQRHILFAMKICISLQKIFRWDFQKISI